MGVTNAQQSSAQDQNAEPFALSNKTDDKNKKVFECVSFVRTYVHSNVRTYICSYVHILQPWLFSDNSDHACIHTYVCMYLHTYMHINCKFPFLNILHICTALSIASF